MSADFYTNSQRIWKDFHPLKTPDLFTKNLIRPDVLKFISRVNCAEKCIVYSARIFTENPRPTLERIQVATGTVFNEILIWDTNEYDCDTGDVIVLKRFVGHEGVIFNIRFNGDHSSMASVSDDRTVRIWKSDDDT